MPKAINIFLTVERLKELLRYDPDTGIFYWLKSRRGVGVGPAGTTTQAGYIKIQIDGTLYSAGRLAFLYMTGKWPKDEVDHKDRNGTNNKWKNLREATRNQNMINTGPATGVYFHKGAEKWVAQIKIDGKIKYLGLYETKTAAMSVYKQAAEQHHGEFRVWE